MICLSRHHQPICMGCCGNDAGISNYVWSWRVFWMPGIVTHVPSSLHCTDGISFQTTPERLIACGIKIQSHRCESPQDAVRTHLRFEHSGQLSEVPWFECGGLLEAAQFTSVPTDPITSGELQARQITPGFRCTSTWVTSCDRLSLPRSLCKYTPTSLEQIDGTFYT